MSSKRKFVFVALAGAGAAIACNRAWRWQQWQRQFRHTCATASSDDNIRRLLNWWAVNSGRAMRLRSTLISNRVSSSVYLPATRVRRNNRSAVRSSDSLLTRRAPPFHRFLVWLEHPSWISTSTSDSRFETLSSLPNTTTLSQSAVRTNSSVLKVLENAPTIAELPELQTGPSLIAISPRGTAAAFLNRASGFLQTFRGMPDAPELAYEFDTSFIPGEATAIAVNDDGNVALLNFADGEAGSNTAWVTSSNGALWALPSSHVSSMAFLPHRNDAIFADAGHAGNLLGVGFGRSGESYSFALLKSPGRDTDQCRCLSGRQQSIHRVRRISGSNACRCGNTCLNRH